jgi:hypothetical protein
MLTEALCSFIYLKYKKDGDVSREYLSERKREVISIMTTLFDLEEISRAYGRT